jgi:hypothetical protein
VAFVKLGLNRHLHYHCCILDGVFEPLGAGAVLFRQASAPTPEAVAAIEQQVRRRVLRLVSRHGLLDPDDARDMLAWASSGFSLDASVCIAGSNRAGLERLLRYCARPRFAVRFAGYSRQSVGTYQGRVLAVSRLPRRVPTDPNQRYETHLSNTRASR